VPCRSGAARRRQRSRRCSGNGGEPLRWSGTRRVGGDEEKEEDTLRQGDVGDSRMMFGPD
jgi:hypothetical protein